MEIKSTLAKYEREQGFKIVLAIEAGSRAWGFHSLDSDHDIRFIYVRPLSWYLSISHRRDVFEPNCEYPLDMNGWDIKKVLYQIHKGNPCLFEWLHSPIVHLETKVKADLIALAHRYFNPRTAIYHYLHMAESNYREYLKGETVKAKKYFYVLRPILVCMWIEKHHSMPPVLFEALLSCDLDIPPHIPTIIADLLFRKRIYPNELAEFPRIDALNDWLGEKIMHFKSSVRLTKNVNLIPDDLNEYMASLLKWEEPREEPQA